MGQFNLSLLLILPSELLLRIFSFLDPLSLDSAALVCKYTRTLIDSTAFRNAFLEHYGRHVRFSAVGANWRSEYLTRSTVIRKFDRGRGRNISFDGKVATITHTCRHSGSSILLGNQNNGLVSVADLITGKVQKDMLFPGPTRLTSIDVTAMSVSKYGVAYGFLNGVIAANIFAKNSHNSSTYRSFRQWHSSPVTSILMLQGNTPGAPTILSGDSEGSLMIWDHRLSQGLSAQLKVSHHPIKDLFWDDRRSRCFALTSTMEFLLLDLSDPGVPTIIQSICCSDAVATDTICYMFCDARCSMMVVITQRHVLHVQFSEKSPPVLAKANHEFKDRVVAAALDPMEYEEDSGQPGCGGRNFCIVDRFGSVSVMDIRTMTQISKFSSEHSATASTVSVNAFVVVIGFVDGAVHCFDILRAVPLRPLRTRIPKSDRIAQEDPLRTKVCCIGLHHKDPAGFITTGGQVYAFDFDPKSDMANGKRKTLSRKKDVGSSKPMTGGASQSHIREVLREMRVKQSEMDAESAKVQKLGGDLLHELDETELMSYAAMLSLENASDRGQISSQASQSGGSSSSGKQRATIEHAHDFPETHYNHGVSDYDEDLALALALSESVT